MSEHQRRPSDETHSEAWINFDTNVLHRDQEEGVPLSKAEVNSIFKHLSTTGSMWVGRAHLDERVLCVTAWGATPGDELGPGERPGVVYNLGPVADNVHVGAGDFSSIDGRLIGQPRPGRGRRG